MLHVVKRSILAKILLGVGLIVLLSLLSSLIAIGSLRSSKNIQNELTDEIIPALNKSQALSQALIDYMYDVNQLASESTSVSENIFMAKLALHEATIMNRLEALVSIAEKGDIITTIRALLEDIFAEVTLLQNKVNTTRVRLDNKADSDIKNILNAVQAARSELKRYRMLEENISFEQRRKIANLDQQLVNIAAIINQYDSEASLEKIRENKALFYDITSDIAKTSTLINSEPIKASIMQEAKVFLAQIDSSDGFWKTAEDIFNNEQAIKELLKQSSQKRILLDGLLAELLDTAGSSIQSGIKRFDSAMDRNITYLFALLVFTLLASLALVKLYILPFVIYRINKLSHNTRQIAKGNFDITVDTSGSDEITDMAKTLETFKLALIQKNLAERAIIENEKRLMHVMNNAYDGIIITDEFYTIESANHAVQALFTYDETELIGHRAMFLFHAENGQSPDKMLEEGNRNIYGVKKNGAHIILNINIAPIVLKNKTLFSITLRDITQEKIFEQQQEKLIAELTKSNEDLERFAFICSHDLQEPLRMIRSFSERLETMLSDRLAEDEKAAKYFGFVKTGAERAQQMISDILNYSSMGREAEAREPVHTSWLVAHIKEEVLPLFEDTKVVINAQENMPIVWGHKTQLYQLFHNLINNAIKYQPEGASPVVQVSAERDGDMVRFRIKDNGIGIEERHHHKVFDVFQRLHRNTQYSGTGIGLAICKKVVERHGGTITIESGQSVGTTFCFTLPAYDKGDSSGELS